MNYSKCFIALNNPKEKEREREREREREEGGGEFTGSCNRKK